MIEELTFEGHSAQITSIFQLDNKIISRCCNDYTFIWNITTGEKEKTIGTPFKSAWLRPQEICKLSNGIIAYYSYSVEYHYLIYKFLAVLTKQI